jgi:hypothetical protein
MKRTFWIMLCATLAASALVGGARAQSSGAVPANCQINASANTLTCTTTVQLTNVAGTFGNGGLTLAPSGSQGPTCNGGLVATPSVVTAGVATNVSLQACPNNTNRSQLIFRWLSPATQSAGADAWVGAASVNLAAGANTTLSVDVCASAAQDAACTRASATINTSQATAPSCSAIAPASQQVAQNGTAAVLSVTCSNATSYQWYAGASAATGTAISGATGATYTPPTTAVGTLQYSVRASNNAGSTDVAAASVTVNTSPPIGQGCPAGEPRVVSNFLEVKNFAYTSLIGSSGAQAMLAVRITVGANDTTIGKVRSIPTFMFVQEDGGYASQRTVTLSENCLDFNVGSGGARLLFENTDGGSLQFVTAGDSRASDRVPALTPGRVYYINIRNDTCPAGFDCRISGIWQGLAR